MRTLLFLALAGTMALVACTGSKQSGSTPRTDSAATQQTPPTGIDAIYHQWLDGEKIQVKDSPAGFKTMLEAFGNQYPQFEPNKQIARYLRDEDVYNSEETGYSIDDQEGYDHLTCLNNGARTITTSASCLKRANGHFLMTVFMAEDDDARQMLFYDFDPATRQLAPDKETAAPFFELARQSGEWAIVQKVGEQDFYFVDFAPGGKEASRETLMHWDGMKFVAQPQQMKQ